MPTKKLTFKESMLWEKPIEDFVKSRMKGYTLNIPCGQSEIGDVRADIEPQSEGVIKMEIDNIKFPNRTFDTVISDPPWLLPYFKRQRPFFHCVRVCKVGGVIIYNAPWYPESKAVELKELWVRKSNAWANTSNIAVYHKISDEYDDLPSTRQV